MHIINAIMNRNKQKQLQREREEGQLSPADKYLREFESCTEEMTVLLEDFAKTCIVNKDVAFPSIRFMAYIDNETGEVRQEQGLLTWVIPHFSKNYIYKFKDYDICRVLVRKCRPDVVNPAGNPYKNRFHLVRLLKSNMSDPRLEAIREQYLKPVFIKDEAGAFSLDRKYEIFRGKVDWLGTSIEVSLYKDADGDTAVAALSTLHLLLADAEDWDRTLRSYAAEELTELANDWRQGDTPEITKEKFANRIALAMIRISKSGGFEIDYEDDDMFYGHLVTVYGDGNGQLDRATIED